MLPCNNYYYKTTDRHNANHYLAINSYYQDYIIYLFTSIHKEASVTREVSDILRFKEFE